MSGRGVERVLDLIEWFATVPGTATLAQVATALDMPKSSALQMLRSLTERGYLSRLESGAYALVRLPGDLNGRGDNHGALLALAGPHLTRGVEESQESGFVAVMDGIEVRYLNKVLPQREIRYDRDMTKTRAAHKVASGVVILAHRPASEIAAYVAAAGLDAAGAQQLDAMIAKARADGFYLNLNGVVEGASGAAAPIIGPKGLPLGAINIAGPQERMATHSAHVCDVVLRTARAVTEEIARRAV
ncbi:helix-turn-helix domain-containing protein [Frigidibacter sp. MR17.14]|uniref:IclR family transcriptional regulator n=1 Tax=Frigidibacter sp. MR17.14 TaxID=3126509 RepID=UPI0030130FE8